MTVRHTKRDPDGKVLPGKVTTTDERVKVTPHELWKFGNCPLFWWEERKKKISRRKK